jgi:hypothetical protein
MCEHASASVLVDTAFFVLGALVMLACRWPSQRTFR